MVLGKKQLALQSSFSRYLDRFTEENVSQLQSLNHSLIDKARLIRNDTELIIDVDSTHSNTFVINNKQIIMPIIKPTAITH